jgi:hypothetical protein
MKPWPTGPRFRVIVVLSSLGLSGCASGLESDYGSSRAKSINGTAVFASMLRDQAHEVRAAIRLTDELAEWSEGIVRFAPLPGPPARDEANWYRDWLGADVNRWLIYVVRDFDATHEYWVESLAQLPASEDPEHRTEAEEARDKAADWVNRLPRKASEVANAKDWFKLESEWNPPRILTKLSGPWAKGIDAKAAGLTAHEPLHASGGRVLLAGDDKPFVLEKPMADDGRVLIIANGSFLLNEPLVNSARRPLAERVVEWTGDTGRRVALVEGRFVLGGPPGPKSLWELVCERFDVRWAFIHLSLAGGLAALARAPRLGRPRLDPASDSDQPAAHARALGALLRRVGAATEALELLDSYRRWRYPRTRESSTHAPRPIARSDEASTTPLSQDRNAPNG